MFNILLTEKYEKLKERLEAIVEQLKTLGTQHEDVKLQLQEANDVHNFARVSQLQNELDLISTQQMQLINEQSELSRLIKRYDRSVFSSIARGQY